MSYFHVLPPSPQATEAAVTLGEYLKAEHGRSGVRAYLAFLSEQMPRDWTEQLARRLDLPYPPPEPPHGAPMPPLPQVPSSPPPPPPEPRPKKQPDMEKILQLMQIMNRS